MQSEEHISAVVPALGSFSAPDLAIASGKHARSSVPSPSTSFAYSRVKRLIDVVLVLAAAPIWVPLCMVLSLLVRFTSPGPVFFSHRRIGHHGAFFSMWKFRTMCTNSAEVLEKHLASHPEDRASWARDHKLRNDPRITPIGWFLRKSSLDELPQLWNVITGRMSLVGPRPIVAAEVEKYNDDFAYYVSVDPGISGLWQCSGRSSLTYKARVALDRQYVETWSLGGDLKILIKTAVRVLQFKDAA